MAFYIRPLFTIFLIVAGLAIATASPAATLNEETTEVVVVDETPMETVTQPVTESEMVVEESVLEEAVVKQAVVEEAYVEEAVVEEAVVEEAVVEEAYVEDAVLEEAVVEEAVVEEAVVEEAVVENEMVLTTTAAPKITYSRETVAKIGDTLVLDCGVEGLDLSGVKDFEINWDKIDVENPINSLPLTDGTNVILFTSKYEVIHPEDSYQYSLRINDLQQKDIGTYRCSVQFGEDQKITADVPVMLEKAAYFVDDVTQTLTITEGDSLSIDCRPGGFPTPDVYWERIEHALPYYGGSLYRDNKLEIPDIKREHRGQYVCHADNGLSIPATSELLLHVQYTPDIAVKEEMVYAGQGDSATLTCAARGLPEPDVAWFKDGQIILGSANLRVSRNTKETDGLDDQVNLDLSIDEVTAEDFGVYTCRAVNEVNSVETNSEITMKTPPRIFQQTEGIVYYEQDIDTETLLHGEQQLDTLSLECRAEGVPPPKYAWIKDSNVFETGLGTNFVVKEGTLTIINATSDEAGIYQCIAYNDLGKAISSPITVAHRISISFVGTKKPVYNVEAELGRPYMLQCPNIAGKPKPLLRWIRSFKSGDTAEFQFVTGSISKGRTIMDEDGALWFSYIASIDDSAKNDYVYVCVASYGDSQSLHLGAEINLSVVEPKLGPGNSDDKNVNIEPLLVKTSESNLIALAGDETKIWCIATGEPVPQVIWSRDDELDIFDDGRVRVENAGATLVIPKTRLEDAATYTCVVHNGVGVAKTFSSLLEVEARPEFVSELESQTVRIGDDVSFTCDVNSTRDVGLSWLFNAAPLKISAASKRKFSESGSILNIQSVTPADIGNYACTAKNELGSVYGQAILNVAGTTSKLRSSLSTNTDKQCDAINEMSSQLIALGQSIKQLHKDFNHINKNNTVALNKIQQRLTAIETMNKP